MRQIVAFSPVESTFERDEGRSNAEFDMFWKEVFLEGTWKHPHKGFTIKADKARMEKWAKNFLRQKELDIEVPVPYGHSYSPDRNAGFVEGLEVRKKENGKHSIFALLGIPLGDDSKKINKTVKSVSIALNPNMKHSSSDGKVTDLGECIEHVALTNYPIISGMQDFVAFDQEGDTVVIAHLDLISDEVNDAIPEGYTLNQEQVREYAADVAQNVIAAYTVNQKLKLPSKGDKEMGVTSEQLRTIEQTFSFEANTLTEENWFEKVNGVKLIKEKVGVTSEQLRAIEQKFDIEGGSLTEENWFEKVNGVKLNDATSDPLEFDIEKNPEFQKLMSANHSLILDRNERRLEKVESRLKDALEVGRLNKAAYDKIVTKEEQMQFSQESCVGDEWDSWISGVELQLSIIEELPEGHTVSVTRETAGHVSNMLDQADQSSDEESEKMDKEVDEDIKVAVPQYHEDNVKLDPKTGIFASVEQ